VIFKEGDPSNGKLYIIYSGEVSVVKKPQEEFFATQKIETDNSIEHNGEPDPRSLNEIFKEDGKVGSAAAVTRSEKTLTVPPRFPENRKLSDTESVSIPSPRQQSMRRSQKRSVMRLSTVSRESPGRNTSEQVIDLEERSPKRSSSKGRTPNRSPDASPVNEGVVNFEILPNVKIDLKRLNALNPRKKFVYDEDDEFLLPERAKAFSTVLPEADENRRKGWTAIRRILPFVARTKKGAEGKKIKSMPLHKILEQFGNVEEKIKKGGFFGERAVYERKERATTIVTNTECQVFVIYKRDFYLISRNYDKKRTKLMNFVFNFIQDVENIHTFLIVEEFLPLLKKRTHEKGNFIVQEGHTGDCCYVIYDGTCEIIKNLKINEAPSKRDFFSSVEQLVRVRPMYGEELSVCNVDKGTFMGEEVLFTNSNVYNFSVKVTSAYATILTISRDMLFRKFTKLTQANLKDMFFEKKKKNVKLINSLIENKYPNMEIIFISNEKAPVVTDGETVVPELPFEEKLFREQILLRPKQRTEIKRKVTMGLYRALAEKASDSSILSLYNGVIQTPMITSAQRENITKRPTSLNAKRSKPILLQAFPENAVVTVKEEPEEKEGTAASQLPRLNLSTLQKLDTMVPTQADMATLGPILSVPSHTHVRNKTLTIAPQEPTRMVTRQSDRHLKLDNLLDQYVNYITTARHYNVQNLMNEEGGTPKTTNNGTIRESMTEVTRDGQKKFTGRGKERYTSNGFTTQRTEIGRTTPMEFNFNEDLLPLDKKSQKFLEIKKNRMRNKSSDFTSGGKRSTSKENLIENLKERYQTRVKKTLHSSRSGTPNTRVLLLIKSPKIEKLAAAATAEPIPESIRGSASNKTSYINYPTTGKASLKSSISYPINFDLPNDLDDLDDINIDPEPERPKLQELSLKKKLEEIQVDDRAITASLTHRTKSAARPMTSVNKDILDKAKNDMNTKMLRMKYKKSMKNRQLRESQEKNLSEIPPGKGGILLDYQVNGNKQCFRGHLIQKVTKKRTPSDGFFTCRGTY